MRTVAGRLKSDYRYSGSVVYNTFPWPTPTDEQKAKIEQTAQAILDARALYPNCSLADLYDEVAMPPELRKAHQANDKAVMQAYGFLGKIQLGICLRCRADEDVSKTDGKGAMNSSYQPLPSVRHKHNSN